MKQTRQKQSAAKPARAKKLDATQSATQGKDWSVKIDIRLPHKIGQPLGSSSGDGCS